MAPGKPAIFSLKSADKTVDLTTLLVRFGLSRFVHHPGAFPEDLFPDNTTLESAEHARPATGPSPTMISGSSLVISPGPRGVYEIKVPLESNGPAVVGYVSFRYRATWTARQYRWFASAQVFGMYFGLEYGPMNTGVFAAMNSTDVIAGGPLLAYDFERPQESASGFSGVLHDYDLITLSFVIDPNEPTVGEQVRVFYTTPALGTHEIFQSSIALLGQFLPPESGFSQNRGGPTDTATLFFGNASDSDNLLIESYGIFPRASSAIRGYISEPFHTVKWVPDLPVLYRADEGRLFDEPTLCRWYGSPGITNFYYQPGRKNTPFYASIVKPNAVTPAVFQRAEPRIGSRIDGYSFEGFFSGKLDFDNFDDSGLGILIDDGEKLCRLSFLDNGTVRTFGVLIDPLNTQHLDLGYTVELDDNGDVVPYDFNVLHYIRVIGDRARGTVLIFIDDVNKPKFSVPFSDLPSVSYVKPRFALGHIATYDVSGVFNIASFSYLNSYLSWEKSDNLLPTDSGPSPVFSWFDTGQGAYSKEDGSPLVTEKQSYGSLIGKASFFHAPAPALGYRHGAQVDFRCRVTSYTSERGEIGAPYVWTGAGVTLFLGGHESALNHPKKVTLGFFDCGVYGRKIGIVPANGDVEEILKQTPLGRARSADWDWGKTSTYRLVYRYQHAIEVWADSFIDKPLIVIPWAATGFDLEDDHLSMDQGIAFGHFSSGAASVVEWDFVRWGVSSGYEFSISQDQPQLDMFGGKEMLMVSAQEIDANSGTSGGGTS